MGEAIFPSYEYFNVSSPAPYVAHVEINRPNKLNAWIEPMWLELRHVFSDLTHNTSVRSIVLSGSGSRAFTTGLDVQGAQSSPFLSASSPVDGARKAFQLQQHVLEFQACISSLQTCPKPIICVLHGYSYGLAIDIACAADVRICAADTTFCVKEVDIGLAADIGTLSRLPKCVGSYSWCKEVCLSARVFGADEALQQGFVSRVGKTKEDVVREAGELAALIAEKSPVAVRGTKELLDYSRDHGVEDGLRYTAVWNSAMVQTLDVQASMAAGARKKKPTFEKL